MHFPICCYELDSLFFSCCSSESFPCCLFSTSRSLPFFASFVLVWHRHSHTLNTVCPNQSVGMHVAMKKRNDSSPENQSCTQLSRYNYICKRIATDFIVKLGIGLNRTFGIHLKMSRNLTHYVPSHCCSFQCECDYSRWNSAWIVARCSGLSLSLDTWWKWIENSNALFAARMFTKTQRVCQPRKEFNLKAINQYYAFA